MPVGLCYKNRFRWRKVIMSEASIYRTGTIIGDKVRNYEGVELGELKDLLIDTETGKIEYGVLSFGGFMGVGEKEVAVPFEAFVLKEGESFFLLNVDKETLDTANTQIEYQGSSYYIY